MSTPISLKWKMNQSNFTAEYEGYEIVVGKGLVFGAFSGWHIIKEGFILDSNFDHPPTRGGELAGKAAAERALTKIINNE